MHVPCTAVPHTQQTTWPHPRACLTAHICAGQHDIFPVTGAILIDDCCELPAAKIKPAPAPAAPAAPVDPCEPGGALCGPVRPKEDYGADIVLTKGWMGEKEVRPTCRHYRPKVSKVSSRARSNMHVPSREP